MIPAAAFTVILLLTYVGVELFRRWSVKKNFLDVPNERSSHKTPTPRGGGIIIAAVCFASYLITVFFYPPLFSWGYLLGVIVIAIVSWLDDVYSIWFLWKLLAHVAAAVIFVTDVQILHGGDFSLTYMAVSLSWVVVIVNAYNFMDGIDGLAGLQAVITAFSWLVLSYMLEATAMFYFSGAIAFASLGFLLHNWPPAKIFMGDIGSAFLGFTFAALPFMASKEALNSKPHMLLLASALFLWFFLFDSILTRSRRLLSGKNVFSAHREHFYQRLALSGMSHGKVTLTYGILALILNISVILSIKFYDNVYPVVFIALAILTAVLVYIYINKLQKPITR